MASSCTACSCAMLALSCLMEPNSVLMLVTSHQLLRTYSALAFCSQNQCQRCPKPAFHTVFEAFQTRKSLKVTKNL